MFVPSVTHPIGDFVREWVPRLAEYLPANIQSEDLNSVVAFLINAVICIIAVCVVNIGSAPILIYMERKVCAHVQCRLGPMRLGWHGTLQTIADVIKMLFKEVYAPSGADKLMFYLAPLIVLIAPFIVCALIPFDKNLVVADVSMGIPLIIAVNGFGVLGILLGGWSSNNKYSLLGALRSGAQMISYEISFAMILLFVVMISGSTNLMSITMGQEGTIFDWWIFKIPVLGFIAFILFFISSTAEMNRAPFDIAEAEQELTGGYHTEYNGTPFAMVCHVLPRRIHRPHHELRSCNHMLPRWILPAVHRHCRCGQRLEHGAWRRMVLRKDLLYGLVLHDGPLDVRAPACRPAHGL